MSVCRELSHGECEPAAMIMTDDDLNEALLVAAAFRIQPIWHRDHTGPG